MSSKNLSILFRKDGFSFCVLRNGEIIHSDSVEVDTEHTEFQEFKKIFDANLYLQQTYAKVDAALLTNRFNLVPEEIFESDPDAQKWLEFNAEVFENDVVQSEIAGHGARIVYAVPGDLKKLMHDRFGEVEIKNASQVFIGEITAEDDNPQVFVNVHADVIEILLLKDKKLFFYNIFDTKTREDVVYYILNTFKQLGLDPNETALYYFGWTKDHQSLKMLMNFVRHVIPGTSEPYLMQHFTEIKNTL